MTRITLTQLVLGVSLCFASASFAYDRHVVSAALAVGPANISIDHQASRAPFDRGTGVDLGLQIAWWKDARPSSRARVAAAFTIELEHAKWI